MTNYIMANSYAFDGTDDFIHGVYEVDETLTTVKILLNGTDTNLNAIAGFTNGTTFMADVSTIKSQITLTTVVTMIMYNGTKELARCPVPIYSQANPPVPKSADKKYTLALDLVKDTENVVLISRIADKDLTSVLVKLTNNGEAINLVGRTPLFECQLPAQTGEYANFVRDDGIANGNMIIVDAEQGIIQYNFVKETFSKVGAINIAYFALETLVGDVVRRVTTRNFKIIVTDSAIEGKIDADDYISDIESLKAEIEIRLAPIIEEIVQLKEDVTEASAQMDEIEALITANQVIKTEDAINWQKQKITDDTGANLLTTGSDTSKDILDIIKTAGIGLRTFYAVSGAVNNPTANTPLRGISHLTTATTGWVIGWDSFGNSYSTFLNGTAGWVLPWKENATMSDVANQLATAVSTLNTRMDSMQNIQLFDNSGVPIVNLDTDSGLDIYTELNKVPAGMYMTRISGTAGTTNPNTNVPPTTIRGYTYIEVQGTWGNLYGVGSNQTMVMNQLNSGVWRGWRVQDARDTGWINITGFNSGWSTDATNPPAYRKVGNKVSLRGVVHMDTAAKKGVIATLPAGYRPMVGNQNGWICARQTTGVNYMAEVYVSSAGNLEVVWINGNGTQGIWLTPIEFYID